MPSQEVNKRLFVAAIVCSAFVCVVLWKFEIFARFNPSTPATPPRPGNTDSITPDSTLVGPAVKKIFYYESWFNIKWKDSHFLKGKLSCPNGIECILTCNESDYLTSDAVIIHAQAPQNGLPSNRPPNQKWVYMNRECPRKSVKWYDVKNVIDLTMTYILSSDIVFNYGTIIKGNFSGGFNMSRNYLEGKTQIAAAVVSDCAKPRMDYIHALTKFMNIHIYGKCGNMSLCKEPSCWDQLRVYKFYLAFENNICADYVTEKLYVNALMHEMVPIVMGGGNYSNPSIAPPGGYINAREFSSLKELADFINKVGSDPQLYNQYFHWHSKYNLDRDLHGSAFCQLCSLLHSKREFKRYKDVVKWYEMVNHCEPYPHVS